MTSAIMSTVLMFFLGPIYRRHVNNVLARRQKDIEADDYVEDPFEGQYRTETDDCVDRIDRGKGEVYSKRELQTRRAISALILVCVLVLSGVVNFYLQASAADTSNESAATYIALTISAI